MDNYAASELSRLLIYRNLLSDSLVHKLSVFLADDYRHELQAELIGGFMQKAEQLGLAGNALQNYFVWLIARDENIFSIQAERHQGKVGPSLAAAADHDILLLKRFIRSLQTLPGMEILSAFTPTAVRNHPGLAVLLAHFASDAYSPEQTRRQLIEHYVRYGCGQTAGYHAFRWLAGKGLAGIQCPDAVTLDDIVGNARQKEALLANTAAFIAGRPCNNVLLTGARGTGKSSLVKATANHFAHAGLRLVEVAKHDLKELYDILAALRNSGKKYILFLDDLSFEEYEVDYKHLKSLLEGGVEARPGNVLIYATSNRHHLIRETWDDRGSNPHDIHRFDTVNEKLSLADRFGITITFFTPGQEEYFHIVETLAARNNLPLSSAELRSEALQWEMSHSGRSGRSAQQLILHLLSRAV
ncbi:MAG: ATP-binding protein [Negativicutes bacterium]|nr:ATP-binding protein [Negativicutes bacterium]